MVVEKKSYYGGFHGFIAPVIPKAPRSLRRRSLPSKQSEGGEICAFELLAAVAGKLLQESESSTSSNGSQQKEQHQNHGSGTESQNAGQPINLDLKLEPPLKELPHSDNDSGLERASETSENKNGVNDTPFLGDENIEKQSGVLTVVKTYDLKEEVESCVDNRVLNKSSSRVHLSFYSDHVQRDMSNVNVDIRDDDDDEKYFRYNHRSNKRRVFGSRSRAGYKRIRKMLTSRYRKVAPKPKDYDNIGCGVRSFYHKRKNIYMREEYQAEKRRKLFHHCPKTSNPKDSHVKFSIKSFKVPELYVEVPETATVGSLKRSVMEAVTAILQGKLHVGVVVQGKKVRDDNRTLEQTGISQKCNLETLGFTLEPSLPEPLPSKETPLLLPCNTFQHPPRSPSSPILENNLEKNQENINLTSEASMEDSKALVVVPPLDDEMLSVVPLSEKPTKRYEFSQRRTRRPFSVSEVEALVEAVETLGAGRWRDVKMRAFDDANHRTYVDLKDKWKTLVHTASISPQQRRGEPVPQDLLDRVLAAHAYWSQHQCKHQKTV